LYHSIVLPVIHYGSAIWGHKQYTCINAIHNKACRYYLGVGKYTANAAVQGDTGLTPPVIDQWLSITRQWCRMVNMNASRINKKFFMWSYRYSMFNCKNSIWKTMEYYRQHNLQYLICVNENLDKESALSNVSEAAFSDFLDSWNKLLDSEVSHSGQGGNKLRTYRLFKHQFCTEPYVWCIMGKQHRSALAKFRCGVAPIMLELGRHRGLPVAERTCPFCNNSCVEDEVHVLTNCSLYVDYRNELYECMANIEPGFMFLTDTEKAQMMLSHNNFKIVKEVARICHLILVRRNNFT